MLNEKEIAHFINDGYIRIDNAFSVDTAKQVRDILWNDIPFDRETPETWAEPVVRLGNYTQKPFIESVNNERLHQIYNQLIGPNKWIPCMSVGSFPIRFPSAKQPVDTGKHVDASFAGSNPSNYFEWRVNYKSKGRALLMLVLYSDVSVNDAPTLLYKGTHIDVAHLLYTAGDAGLSFMEIAQRIDALPVREAIPAIGLAGSIYLCHPFLVHAAQAHKGTEPKFMAQPSLFLRGELNTEDESKGFYPVEQAIHLGLT